jgi:hypothetical protein
VRYIIANTAAVAVICCQPALAQLVPVDGGALVDDPTDNLTWVGNMNLMQSQAASYSGGPTAYVNAVIAAAGGVIHDTPNAYDPSGTYVLSAGDLNTATGQMDWWGAQAWIDYLNATDYQGYSDWRLPNTLQGSGVFGAGNLPISGSELAELYFGQLSGTWTGSPFQNTQTVLWNSPEFVENYREGLVFDAAGQQQYGSYKFNPYAAEAVRTGLAPVPLPSAAWLLLSGLGALGMLHRQSKERIIAAIYRLAAQS